MPYQRFSHEINSSTAYQPVARDSVRPLEESPSCGGSVNPTSLRPWRVTLLCRPSTPGAANGGARIKITMGSAEAEVRYVTLDNRARVISGYGTFVSLEGMTLTASETLLIEGSIDYGGDSSAEAHGCVHNRIASRTLSYAQANTDSAISAVYSLGAIQPAAHALEIGASPLTGYTAGSQRVVHLLLFGRRYGDDLWERLGAILVSDVASGRDRVDLVPGAYDEVGYQAVGFLTSGGGSSTFEVREELEAAS